MKSSKSEIAAVQAAVKEGSAAVVKAKAPRKTKAEREGEERQAKDLWMQTTKIVVPAWFGNCGVRAGFKLSEKFSAAGVLALVAVGQAQREAKNASDSGHECEVGMQMKLRPHGFDRQEARDMAERGFCELSGNGLVKLSKTGTEGFPYDYFKLSKKGQKWFDLLEKSAGCAKRAEADED